MALRVQIVAWFRVTEPRLKRADSAIEGLAGTRAGACFGASTCNVSRHFFKIR
jgi:hypothetical protein